MKPAQQGFTLLELLIALALFALLGVACWRLFEMTQRAERASTAHAAQLREVQRAFGIIERDLMHVLTGHGAGLSLREGLLNLQRGHWRNPLDQPRSDWQEVSYQQEGGSLWRHSRGDALTHQRQQLLSQVTQLQFRVRKAQGPWLDHWPAGNGVAAVELQLRTEPFNDLRRVFLLPGWQP